MNFKILKYIARDQSKACAAFAELHDISHLLGTSYDDLFNCLTTRTIWAEVPMGTSGGAGGSGSGRDTPSTTGSLGVVPGQPIGDQQGGSGTGRASGCHMVYRGGARAGCGSSESVPLPSAATSPATSHRQLSQSVIGGSGSTGRQSLNRATSFSRGKISNYI